jgi:Na+/proline symporter
MRPLDLAVLVAFLIYIVWDGARRGREAKGVEGYLLAGRKMRWWTMGLSVMATQASAITILSTTGQGFANGMVFLHFYLAIPFAMVLLCATVVPWFHKSRVYTAYEWLEHRFDRRTRLLAAAIFLVSRALAVGAVMYTPSIVLERGLGIPRWQTILAMGVLSTIYTAIGGNTAVIITDAKQMLVMVAGLIACVVVAWLKIPKDVGFLGALEVAGATNRLDTFRVIGDWRVLLADKYNVFSGLLGGFFLFLGYFGADQEQVQRYLAGSSVDQSRKSLLVSAFAKVPMQFGILLLGVLIFAVYAFDFGRAPAFFRAPELERRLAALPDAEAGPTRARWVELQDRYAAAAAERATAARSFLAASEEGTASRDRSVAELRRADAAVTEVRTDGMKLLADAGVSATLEKNDADYVFTHFLISDVPVGIAGLVLAAIFAAAISSLVSPINSLATSAVWDVWARLRSTPPSEAQVVRGTKLATLFFGAFATVAAFWMGGIPIIEQVNRIGSMVYGSMFGIFVLGRVVPGARGGIGWISLGTGITTVILIAHVLNGRTIDVGGRPWTVNIEFMWFNLIGFVVVMAVGTVAALLRRSFAR